MKIATFNVNSIRSRIDVVTSWLQRRQPDILCVQETKTEDSSFPAGPIQAAGFHVVYRGEKAYNGVAVISRQAPDEWRCGLDDGGPVDEARLIYARFGSLHVVNAYVPQGREIEHAMYRYKLEWFRRLKAYLARHFTARQQVLWVGDLNVAPEAMDIHNAAEQVNHVCYHVDCRKAFADAVSWGLVDVFRKHHPEPGQYTFFDYRTPNAVKRRMGWRIDHVLATPPLARRSADAYIDLEPRLDPRPSDHTVLVAEFDGDLTRPQ